MSFSLCNTIIIILFLPSTIMITAKLRIVIQILVPWLLSPQTNIILLDIFPQSLCLKSPRIIRIPFPQSTSTFPPLMFPLLCLQLLCPLGSLHVDDPTSGNARQSANHNRNVRDGLGFSIHLPTMLGQPTQLCANKNVDEQLGAHNGGGDGKP